MAKRKEHIPGTLKTEGKFTCTNSSCGFIFLKPIKVKNLCEGAEIYEACPRCFTAVTEVANVQVMEAEASPSEDTEVSSRVETKKTESVIGKQCAHRFGYLSVRARDEKIPDDCFMCDNIVKCMTKGMTA